MPRHNKDRMSEHPWISLETRLARRRRERERALQREADANTGPQSGGSNHGAGEPTPSTSGKENELMMKASEAETEARSKETAMWIKAKFVEHRCESRLETLEEKGVIGTQLQWKVNLQLPGFTKEENMEVIDSINTLIAKELACALKAKLACYKDLGPAPDPVAESKLKSRVGRFDKRLDEKLAKQSGEAGTSGGEENSTDPQTRNEQPPKRKKRQGRKDKNKKVGKKSPKEQTGKEANAASDTDSAARTEGNANGPNTLSSKGKGLKNPNGGKATPLFKKQMELLRVSKPTAKSQQNEGNLEFICSKLADGMLWLAGELDRIGDSVDALRKGNASPPSRNSEKRQGGGNNRFNRFRRPVHTSKNKTPVLKPQANRPS